MNPLLLLKYWKYAAGAALIAVVWWQIHSYGDRRYDAGKAHVQVKCDKDSAARQTATEKAIADAKAGEAAAKANNVEVMEDANKKLVAIAADRDSLARLYRSAQGRVCPVAPAESPSDPESLIAAGVAARTREIDAALEAYDGACRRDAVRFEALQAEIRPQL